MSAGEDEYCYLQVTAGPRMGTNFLLDPAQPNRLGRGTDCEITLLDPVCSRVHARVVRRDDGWWLEDADSRNGSFVDEQRVAQVRLQDGARLRLGATEFVFHQSDEPPTLTTARGAAANPTVVKETRIDPRESNQVLLTALQHGEFAHDLLIAYQLAVKLLACQDPDQVICTSLEVLHERTKASVVGFLWANEDGQLRPCRVLPDHGDDVSLNKELTDVVCEQGRAVWVSHHAGHDAGSGPRRYSDAICVPLVPLQVTLGVLHLYLKQGRFRQADFDFAISVANLMAVSLVRTCKDAALAADHARLVHRSAEFDELVGDSPAMQELQRRIGRIARANGSVLIRGESGSGKELVARALHKASARADRPLLSVNCAAIPANLLESQLFGHQRGAFTGADADHRGWFQQADTGTLLLDEIGELPLGGQAKLLRILEGHSFQPVGSVEEVSVDVRVMTATNRDLKELVRQRRFREDLYYRLAVFELELPPLRERGADIERLLDHFLDHFRALHGRPQLRLDAAARQQLLAYHWPGNVRQLRNVIDSAVVLATDEVIRADDLGLRFVEDVHADDSLRLADWERKLVEDALRRTGGRVPEAARLLGIGRATLYRKIEEYGISRPN